MLTAGATAFGLAAYLFLYAFTDGFFEQMIENSTGQLSGHAQISSSQLRQDYSPKFRISDVSALKQKVAELPEVEAVTARIVVKGMLASTRKSMPVELTGIDPIEEQKVTSLATKIVEGDYIQKKSPEGIVLGKKIAEELGIKVGEKLVLTLQQASGDLASAAYKVSGIFDTGSELFDSAYAFVNIGALHNLLAFEPDEASTLAIRLKSRFISQAFSEKLQDSLDDTHLVVEPWEQIMPIVIQMIDMTKIDFYLILIVVFIVVAMGVMNTMLMSVLERTREFGVMMALGTQSKYVIRLVLYEAVVLGAIGMFVGAILGTSVASYYALKGIDLSSLSKSMETIPGMTDVIHPVLIFDHLWLPSLLLFACGIIVSIYPAVKASRLNPVEAIHHV